MKPVMQTVTGRLGNCMSACLASMFELPIEDVPNFYEVAGEEPDAWWAAVREWLAKRGYNVMSMKVDPQNLAFFKGYLMVGGTSPRGNGMFHQVIYKDGELCHDPHPEGGGVLEVDTVDMLYPLDPSALSSPPGRQP